MNAPQQEIDLSEKVVAHYLQQNPNFFESYPQVLADIRLQHNSGKAVSLIERQVSILREQKKKLKRQLQELVDIARENDELNRRIHQLTLRLIDCRRLSEVMEMLKHYLQRDFGADAVALRLRMIPDRPDLSAYAEFTKDPDAGFESFSRIVQEQKSVCGRFKPEQLRYLFSSSVGPIASAALIPLHDAPVFGLLAVGSADPKRFHADQGTVFLSQLGELVSRSIRVCLNR